MNFYNKALKIKKKNKNAFIMAQSYGRSYQATLLGLHNQPRTYARQNTSSPKQSPPTSPVKTIPPPDVENDKSVTSSQEVDEEQPKVEQEQAWIPPTPITNDTRKLEPFGVICVLALRAYTPQAKIAIEPPRILVQRPTSMETLTRTFYSFISSGYSQNDYHELEEPINQAIRKFLSPKTLHVFQMAYTGLDSLRTLYQNQKGNTYLAMKPLLTVLNDAITKNKKGSTVDLSTCAEDDSFVDVWSASEVDVVAAAFRVIENSSSQPTALANWISVVEYMLSVKLKR